MSHVLKYYSANKLAAQSHPFVLNYYQGASIAITVEPQRILIGHALVSAKEKNFTRAYGNNLALTRLAENPIELPSRFVVPIFSRKSYEDNSWDLTTINSQVLLNTCVDYIIAKHLGILKEEPAA